YAQSIGAITIDQRRPDTVWVGTGECWVRNSVSIGNGIYVTTDGGNNWSHRGLDSTERIARILIHPQNPDIVYVAALGALWADSPHRGVYQSADGGKSWNRILYINEQTGCADLAMDPSDPNILYAAMWQFRRKPYHFQSGGPGSGLYKSTDGGRTWRKLFRGLPETELGRIAVAVSPADPNVVYASIEYERSAIFRSDDKGESWQRRGTQFNVIERPFYFQRIWCDPVDPNTIFKAGFNLIISRDGGLSFTAIGGGHGDDHDLWINPRNPDQLVLGTDGGLYISNNKGGSYYLCRSLPIAQFYRISYDMEQPYNVYGGLQDNMSWYGPSRTNTSGILSKHWTPFSYGDGFWTFPDPSDNNMAYTEIQGGVLYRYDKRTKISKELTPAAPAGQPRYRFNWNTPFLPSRHNPDKLFLGSQYVLVSYDKGESWKPISPDLTTNNPLFQQQVSSGGVTTDNSAAENYCSVFYIAESPADSNTIWAGSDDGLLHLTRDGGKTWSNVSQFWRGLPSYPLISSIEPSRHADGTAYVTLDYHMWGNMRPYVLMTTDWGKTWTLISNDSIKGFCHIIREDLINPNLLFVGTELGLFFSLDRGKSWSAFTHQHNLPPVPVRDLAIHPRDQELIVGTHGRGIYILDRLELNLLRRLTPAILQQKMVVLDVTDYLVPLSGIDFFYLSDDEFTGANPTTEARLAYYLKDRQLVGEARIETLDSAGNVVNSVPAGKRKGINIVSIPVSYRPPRVPPAPRVAGGAITGPRLPEGTYTARLIRGKDSITVPFSIRLPEYAPYTAADRQQRHRALMTCYRLFDDLTYTVHSVLDLQQKVQETLAGGKTTATLSRRLKALAYDLDTFHSSLVNRVEGAIQSENANRIRENLADTYGMIQGYEGPLSISTMQRVETLKVEVTRAEQQLQRLLQRHLPDINKELQRLQLPALQRISAEDAARR
ncbi:MAG: hypothetical protein NZM08_03935, partial [Chitinophagales bacterium]|nr:hypothetical protein [Chitinophagales bacterium]